LENKAIIIFSDHVKPIELIQEHFGEKTCQIITGDTNVKTRFQIVQNYQQGKIQILAATIGAASTGFNLTRGQNLVFNDLSWVPANNDQAISRIYRHGQSGSCTIHKIIGSKSSLHIMKILETKSELLKKVL